MVEFAHKLQPKSGLKFGSFAMTKLIIIDSGNRTLLPAEARVHNSVSISMGPLNAIIKGQITRDPASSYHSASPAASVSPAGLFGK